MRVNVLSYIDFINAHCGSEDVVNILTWKRMNNFIQWFSKHCISLITMLIYSGEEKFLNNRLMTE